MTEVASNVKYAQIQLQANGEKDNSKQPCKSFKFYRKCDMVIMVNLAILNTEVEVKNGRLS